jgi:hypothetical protein
MNITIQVVDPKEMRPLVDGVDWHWLPNGDLMVQLAPMSDWRREVLLGFHEAVEAVLCKHNGVSQQAVDAFDVEYDKTHDTDCNAGDDPLAPYHREHTAATAVERILAYALSVQWGEYDAELAGKYPGPSHKKK